MDSGNQYLAMLLDAPLQSWGYMSRFDRRTTYSSPTRSGIIGMLCAAMGVDRKETEELERFKKIMLTIFVLAQGGRLMDYHTVGGGWQKDRDPKMIVPRTNGSPGDTVQTYREYLEDSKFLVVINSANQFLTEIAEALQHPQWGIWLGRKACIPAMPVYQGIFESMEAAIRHLEGLYGWPSKAIFEVKDYEDGSDTLMTEPIDFLKREFAPNRIKVQPF